MRKLLFYFIMTTHQAFSHELPHCESLTYSPFPLEHAREIKIALHDNVARVRFPSLQTVHYVSLKPEKVCADALAPDEWRRFGLFSTNEVSAFDHLQAQERIGGFAGKHWLTQNEFTQAIAELGVQPSLETLLAAKIDAIFTGPYHPLTDSDRLASVGIEAIPLMDIKEINPLGRVEWLYFFGLVLSRFDQAHHLVTQIKSSVAELTSDKSSQKKKFLIGHFYHGQWFTPGAEHELVQLINKVGGQSVFSDLKGRGPYSVSFEEVMKRYEQIDIWIPQASWGNLQEGLLLEGRHAFLNRTGGPQIFLLKKEEWSIPFFESGVMRPDLVMKDLTSMMSGLAPEYFFKVAK
jgi:iron complex transport system substrate-binding protein